MTHKDIARAIANACDPPAEGGPDASLVRYCRADGASAAKEGEAQCMSRYNPLTKRLRAMLYPHRETIGLFYSG